MGSLLTMGRFSAWHWAINIMTAGLFDEPPKQGVGIQEKPRKSLPVFEFAFGKRLEEFGANQEFSLHAAGLALAILFAEGLKTNEGLAAAGDDDLLAFTGLFNEAREVSFCVLNLDCGHVRY